ncbi:hypothetical protein [Legionella clemsonensis]|uniref:Coiled coil protein n=1 Tax=Legionella clemsonensis TaxID=1867846 RepID=A0A222P3H7_9GAMM|nr:hypothetical protein [Legionella clemsonensis]ASQ46382.1 hypothetical protein clem_09155 [Legionella clemsonensis]
MLRTLNKASGYIAGAILYPLNSLFINCLIATATVSIAMLILIGLPIHQASVAYNTATERKFISAILAGVNIAALVLIAVPFITGVTLVLEGFITLYDLVKSMRLGAKEGYENGLFNHVLKQAFGRVLIFSTLSRILADTLKPNELSTRELALLQENVEIENTEYNIVDANQLLSEEELDRAKTIPELKEIAKAYQDLLTRLKNLDEAIKNRPQIIAQNIGHSKANLERLAIYVKEQHESDFEAFSKRVDEFLLHLDLSDSNFARPGEQEDLNSFEFNLVNLLIAETSSKDLEKAYAWFNCIEPRRFSKIVEMIRANHLDEVTDEILLLPIENPSLIIKLYQAESGKWRPIPNRTQIIDLAHHEAWLKAHNSHPLTREPMNAAINHVVNEKAYETIYRIFPYEGLNSSYELKALIVQIRNSLSAISNQSTTHSDVLKTTSKNRESTSHGFPDVLYTMANRFFGAFSTSVPAPEPTTEQEQNLNRNDSATCSQKWY